MSSFLLEFVLNGIVAGTMLRLYLETIYMTIVLFLMESPHWTVLSGSKGDLKESNPIKPVSIPNEIPREDPRNALEANFYSQQGT